MGQLVKVSLSGTEVWMETETAAIAELAPQKVSRDMLAGDALKATDTLNASIKSCCLSLIRAFETLEGTEKPKQIGVEFGIKLSSDCKFYIVNASGEASLKITMQW
jgi:hypothetical protein